MIQSEWIFLQQVTNNTGDTFSGVEKLLWGIFLPRLFFINSKSLTPLIGTLSTIPAKKANLGLQNPVMSAKNNLSSQCTRAELILAVMGEVKLSTANKLLELR